MTKRDELWWAYLDGELTPAESTQFDQTLSPGQRERVAEDIQMEHALGDLLGSPAPCPKQAWKSALKRVHQDERAARTGFRRLYRWAWLMVPVAAAALVIVVLAVGGRPASEPNPVFLVMNHQDIPSLAASSQVGDGVPGVRAFMEQRSLPVELNPADQYNGENGPYRLLGAREEVVSNERVVELLFDWDGAPARVVIAPKNGIAAREIGKAVAAGTIPASRAVKNVVIAVVGARASRDLIRLVDDQWPAPSEPKVSPADRAPEQGAIVYPEAGKDTQEEAGTTEAPTETPDGMPVEEAPPPAENIIVPDVPDTLATLV